MRYQLTSRIAEMRDFVASEIKRWTNVIYQDSTQRIGSDQRV